MKQFNLILDKYPPKPSAVKSKRNCKKCFWQTIYYTFLLNLVIVRKALTFNICTPCVSVCTHCPFPGTGLCLLCTLQISALPAFPVLRESSVPCASHQPFARAWSSSLFLLSWGAQNWTQHSSTPDSIHINSARDPLLPQALAKQVQPDQNITQEKFMIQKCRNCLKTFFFFFSPRGYRNIFNNKNSNIINKKINSSFKMYIIVFCLNSGTFPRVESSPQFHYLG